MMEPPSGGGTLVGGEALQGRYDILAPISSGAMGAVYRGVDRESGEEVAIKRLLDTRHAARFEIEARLLASLNHPRVVKVLDHLHENDETFIVMNLVRGTDLGEVLKRRGEPGLPIPEATEYARQDRKSTRLNSSHANISYAVFCLKKKKRKQYNLFIIKKKIINTKIQKK